MKSMGEELTRAKEGVVNMATRGQQSSVDTKSVMTTRQKETLEPELEPVREETSKTNTEFAQEIKTLTEKFAAQEALREKERDRHKDERDKLQQEKDKLRRQAEKEIERLKEELRQ